VLPSGPVRYELDDGRLVIMAPVGDIHALIEARITAELVYQGEKQGHGEARCGEVTIILRRDPDRIVGADAVFVQTRSLPARRSREGYLETMPELVVEVRSPNDTGPEIQAKVNDYLAAGVHVVWVADPRTRTVTVHRPGQEPQVITEAETLTLDEIIPGLRLVLAEIFRQ
jgi:Uma2 family endonuclease